VLYEAFRGFAGSVKIGLVQFTPTFRATEPNWERMRAWADSVPADVIVFPELASCGYMYEDREDAEPYVDSRSALQPIEDVARRTGRLIVGGFAERDKGVSYDSAYACGPDGTTVYRKIHLWNRETLIFEPGTKPTIVEFQDHRIGLEVCYDLQFPELAAYLARRGAELIVVPTAWAEETYPPSHGLQPYNHLAIASAFAHGIFVAVVNRTGVERGARFPGQSSLTNPFGQLESLDGEEAVAVKSVDFSQLKPAKRPNSFNDLDHDSKLEILPPRLRKRAHGRAESRSRRGRT
jgi:predicted amidohydrolase